MLFTQQTMNEDLERLVRICAHVIPQTSGVSVSVPVRHEGLLIGSLNLYSHVPHAFDARSEEAALVFAAEAAVSIVASDLFRQAKALRTDLQQAHDDEATVSRAEGVLMGIHGCTAVQAQTLLESAADANDETLTEVAEVAERILETVREFEDAPSDR